MGTKITYVSGIKKSSTDRVLIRSCDAVELLGYIDDDSTAEEVYTGLFPATILQETNISDHLSIGWDIDLGYDVDEHKNGEWEIAYKNISDDDWARVGGEICLLK